MIQTISRPLVFALAVTLAWFAGASLRGADAGYSPLTTFLGYSYENSSCTSASDPVTVVFTFGSGSASEPYSHASLSDHGDWDEHGGGQYFSRDSTCSSSDDSAADGDHDRSHMRWEMASTTIADYSHAATQHQETWHWDIWPFTGHNCVHPDGFVDARDEVMDLWDNTSDSHNIIGPPYNYWGNTALIEKCDDEMAGSDGYLAYIDLR